MRNLIQPPVIYFDMVDTLRLFSFDDFLYLLSTSMTTDLSLWNLCRFCWLSLLLSLMLWLLCLPLVRVRCCCAYCSHILFLPLCLFKTVMRDPFLYAFWTNLYPLPLQDKNLLMFLSSSLLLFRASNLLIAMVRVCSYFQTLALPSPVPCGAMGLRVRRHFGCWFLAWFKFLCDLCTGGRSSWSSPERCATRFVPLRLRTPLTPFLAELGKVWPGVIREAPPPRHHFFQIRQSLI